jgi:hypothetical protein
MRALIEKYPLGYEDWAKERGKDPPPPPPPPPPQLCPEFKNPA